MTTSVTATHTRIRAITHTRKKRFHARALTRKTLEHTAKNGAHGPHMMDKDISTAEMKVGGLQQYM